MVYDENTLDKLSKAYDQALKDPTNICRGAIYGKPPFNTVEGERVTNCKRLLSVSYGIVTELLKMSEPYSGIVADCVKDILNYLVKEFLDFGVEIASCESGDFVPLARRLVDSVEKAIYEYPCGVCDRILARACTLLSLYLNN